jgi:hypothetical protein
MLQAGDDMVVVVPDKFVAGLVILQFVPAIVLVVELT